MVQFLSINFFSFITSIFVGFFKSSHFLCHPVVAQFFSFFLLTFESSGKAISISRQVFSFLSFSTVSGRSSSIVRPVITDTPDVIVIPLTFMSLQVNVHSTCQYPITTHVYIRSRDVTSHLIVSVSVFRLCNCCASPHNVYVSCGLLHYITSCIYCQLVVS